MIPGPWRGSSLRMGASRRRRLQYGFEVYSFPSSRFLLANSTIDTVLGHQSDQHNHTNLRENVDGLAEEVQ